MQRENICDSLAFAYIVDLCLFLYCRFFFSHYGHDMKYDMNGLCYR